MSLVMNVKEKEEMFKQLEINQAKEEIENDKSKIMINNIFLESNQFRIA